MQTARTALLVIGGVDPTGSAGLAADLATAEALGFHACPIVTALTVQNSQGVKSVDPVERPLISSAIEQANSEFSIGVAKLGLVPHRTIAEKLHEVLSALNCLVVIDPVFQASSGDALAKSPARELWRDLRFQRVLWTPNLMELQQFVGQETLQRDEIRDAMFEWSETLGGAVLLKGGHHPSQHAVDYLLERESFTEFLPQSIGSDMRGTGCRLATAIACFRAQHDSWATAVPPAKAWLESLRSKAEGACL